MILIDKTFNTIDWSWQDCFIKHLSKNDDSGRHGVLIQKEFYSFFPDLNIQDTSENYKSKIKFAWKVDNQWISKLSNYIYYHRYPERRLSSLNPEKLNQEVDRVILIAKSDNTYRAAVFISGTKEFKEIIKNHHNLKFEEGYARKFSIENLHDELEREKNELLGKLKNISNKGWVTTLRPGATGIGFTLESLLNIQANSSQNPDYKGIEIKSTRANSNVRITLFSKTPTYKPYTRDRLVNTHGYLDENGRLNLNQSLYFHGNNIRGWSLKYLYEDRLFTMKDEEEIFYWLRETLREKLQLKHHRTMFVYANTRGAGSTEQFNFTRAVYARNSDIDNFDRELVNGNVSLDLVMHKKANGTIRDHGFLFKISKHNLINLFKDITEFKLSDG